MAHEKSAAAHALNCAQSTLAAIEQQMADLHTKSETGALELALNKLRQAVFALAVEVLAETDPGAVSAFNTALVETGFHVWSEAFIKFCREKWPALSEAIADGKALEQEARAASHRAQTVVDELARRLHITAPVVTMPAGRPLDIFS